MPERWPPPTRRGLDAYEVVSALQKAVRRSDPEAAAYWAIELAPAHGNWLWSRLKTIAIEDCAPEATGLVTDITVLHRQWENAKGEDPMTVVRAAVALAIAPKSRVACWMTLVVANDAYPPREPPDEARDMHTRAGKRMGRGIEHFIDEAAVLVPWSGDLAELEADMRERFMQQTTRTENR